MMLRRSLQIVGAAVALVTPLASFAQTVTTSPANQPAPALSMPALLLLAVAMACVAAYTLRKRAIPTVRALVLVVGLTVLVGVAYAGFKGIELKGTDCNITKVQAFDSGEPLMNSCPNPIQIIRIDCGSSPALVTGVCTQGQVLANGDGCDLPICME